MRGLGFLIFVALTVVCWGVYGPVLHEGQVHLGTESARSSLRPFICVGIAYFLIAVLVPIFVLSSKGEQGSWSLGGFVWSFLAGAIGAFGALGIILAFKFQGRPTYVMPLVFGMAPVVNTVCTMFFGRTFKEASTLFYVGVFVVAVGAAGVMSFKPAEHRPPAIEEKKADGSENVNPGEENDASNQKTADGKQNEQASASQAAPIEAKEKVTKTGPNYPLIFASIALTALCWGAYGPVLHRGQMKMGQSRLRPFLCVGLAYFVIAVVMTYLLLPTYPEPGDWTVIGTIWSLLGGAAGALGALGIIYAFNFGGKPIFVMPLVFGLAPIVNTFTEITTKSLTEEIPKPFYLSLVVTILGAVMVLVCAPRSHPPAPPVVPESAKP